MFCLFIYTGGGGMYSNQQSQPMSQPYQSQQPVQQRAVDPLADFMVSGNGVHHIYIIVWFNIVFRILFN